MAEPDNIVLEHLRAIRTQLDDLQREVDSIDADVSRLEHEHA